MRGGGGGGHLALRTRAPLARGAAPGLRRGAFARHTAVHFRVRATDPFVASQPAPIEVCACRREKQTSL